jgi:hypothetical protein
VAQFVSDFDWLLGAVLQNARMLYLQEQFPGNPVPFEYSPASFSMLQPNVVDLTGPLEGALGWGGNISAGRTTLSREISGAAELLSDVIDQPFTQGVLARVMFQISS